MHWFYVLLIVASVFAVPIVLGYYISRAVRLPDQSWRIALVLFSILASAVVTYVGWPPKLGIDLSGGSILVYEVKDFSEKVDMEKLIAAVTLRVNPGGVKEVTIRPYGVGQIELIIPKASPEELADIKEKISATGLLEFRILANSRDHTDIIKEAEQLDNNVNNLYHESSNGTRELVAQWVPVLPAEVSKLERAIVRKNDKDQEEALVVMDDYDVNGGYLESASPGIDQRGQPAVNFVFNSRGAKLFEGLTRDNLPDDVQHIERQLSIILDGTIYSAPNIKSVISARGEISGNFTREQTAFLSEVLTAGSLPTALRKDPSTELVTGPTLGADTIRRGVNSMAISTIAVMVFMIVYYRFAGVVANLALALNVLLIVAFMILFKAAFTLSGLAGLALTVGMAVDANVLIYERMREERSRGATLRMAIRNGFGRATTTIIDANVTTLIAAVVLYAIGTDQVKGFAVTLILGILMNLFTAITCSRLCFDIAEKMRWIKDLKFLHILSSPNFDFIGKRVPAITLSLILITIGMIGVVARGKGLLDIDFTGGVSVEVLFEEPQTIASVREKLAEVSEQLPDVTVQDVQIAGETPNKRFVINTSRQDEEGVDATDFVENQIEKLFPGKLAVNRMTIKQVAAIEAKSAEKPADATKSGEKSAPAGDSKAKPTEKQGAEFEVPRTLGNPLSDAHGLLASADSGESASNGSLLALLAQDDAKGSAEKKSAEAAKDAPKDAAKDAAKSDAAKSDAAKSDAAKSDAAKSDAPKSEAAKSEPAKSEAAKSETAKSDESTSTDKAAPAPAAKDAAKSPAKAPSTTASKQPTGPAKVERFVGGASARLEFTTRITQKRLDEMIRAEIKQLDPTKTDVSLELSSPDDSFTPGSDKGFLVWNVKLALAPQQAEQALKGVSQKLAAEPSFPSSNKIGAAVAGNTQRQAIVALLASMVLIVIYVWFRFSQIMFGLAGIIALVHDVLVTLGALAVSYWLAPYLGVLLVEPFKISLPVVAAFLTIIGYSINDTIVIFDRIREVRGKSPHLTVELCNACINQTLSRTILTSLTVFIVVLILYAVGGQGIHGFAFAMVVGVVSGTYSTVYIATPLVLWMNRSAESKPKPLATDERNAA